MPAPLLRLLSPKLWDWLERTLSALPQESHGRPFEHARAQAAWGGRITGMLTLALLITAFAAVIVSITVLQITNLVSGRASPSGTGTAWSVTVWRFRAFGAPADVLLHYSMLAVMLSALVFAVLRPYVLELAVGVVLSAAWSLSPAAPDLPVSRTGVLFSALAAVSPVVVSVMLRVPLIFYGLLWLMVLFPARRAITTGVPVTEAVYKWDRLILFVAAGAAGLYSFLQTSRSLPVSLP